MLNRQNLRTAKAFFAFAVLATVGACADSNTVAPEFQAPAVHAPANFLQVGSSVVFRVDNADGVTQQIGDHILYLQPNAICDLLTSGYGASTWDTDCSPYRGSVTITATVFQGPDGQPYVDFQPAMRFSPSKQAYVFFREGETRIDQMLTVEYCNNLGYCVDESLTDPSLKPFRVAEYQIVGRRVKHFSGYVVAYDCPEGEVCPPPDSGMARRSGYMVASGEDLVDVLKKKGVFDKHDEQ